MSYIQIICEPVATGGKISLSQDAAEECRGYYDLGTMNLQEQFIVLFLNRRNEVLGGRCMFTGGGYATVVDPATLFRVVLAFPNCDRIILSHNHPSGITSPSVEDIRLTEKIKAGAGLFDIKVLDHIILSPNGGEYYSFADDGKL